MQKRSLRFAAETPHPEMEASQQYTVQLLRTVKAAVIRRDLMALTAASGTETCGVIFCHGGNDQLAGQIQAFRFATAFG